MLFITLPADRQVTTHYLFSPDLDAYNTQKLENYKIKRSIIIDPDQILLLPKRIAVSKTALSLSTHQEILPESTNSHKDAKRSWTPSIRAKHLLATNKKRTGEAIEM